MRVKIIMNSWSDRRRAIQHKDKIEQLLQQHGGADIVLTEGPGHAIELARQAVDDGYDLVVAAGGDGTVHEVVNGLVRGGESDALLGVIPIGSGNDFAFALGIPLDVEGAVDRLFTGRERRVDLGRIEDENGRFRYFDNNFGMGMDAMVVARTASINRVYGFFMYLVSVLQTISFYYQKITAEIRFDDEVVFQDVLLLALGIGPRGGGGFYLTPGAVQDDDLIESCTLRPTGRLGMVYLMVRSLKGRHITSKKVTMRQNRRIVIKADLPVPIHIDGEMFAYPHDNVRQVTVTSVPKALRVIV